MNKPLSEKKLAANKVKVAKIRGVLPDPADEMAAAGIKPVPLGPLSKEIAMLVARRKAIGQNQGRAQESLRTHQARLDEAESESAEMSVNNMADPSPTNATLASDARINRNTILVQYDQAKHELEIIPGTLKKLKQQITRLQTEKRLVEKALITSEVTDISEYEDAAIESLARYSAYLCLTGERQPAFTNPKEVGKGLDKQNRLTVRFNQIYAELEAGMAFEKL